jgi:hypothetical protein
VSFESFLTSEAQYHFECDAQEHTSCQCDFASAANARQDVEPVYTRPFVITPLYVSAKIFISGPELGNADCNKNPILSAKS